MSGARLAFEDVSCLRGDRLLFKGMRFTLDAGSAAIVTGPNGSGKTSLLRLAAGLLRPAAGSVARNGDLAWLGEQAALDVDLPLGKALGFWASIDGSAEETTRVLDAMGIGELVSVPVRMLSTGQRRRAALARVMLSDAAIWLLDEPGNGLDTATLDRLMDVIAGHRFAGGIVLLATHQPLAVPDALMLELAR